MTARIEQVLAAARQTYERVAPEALAELVDGGALLVDTRPHEQRSRDGDLPGALVIDRNVLEWRLDPTSPDRIDEAQGASLVVVVCNEGYSSTLAAVSLRSLGVPATDLAGGFQALLAGDHLASLDTLSRRAARS